MGGGVGARYERTEGVTNEVDPGDTQARAERFEIGHESIEAVVDVDRQA